MLATIRRREEDSIKISARKRKNKEVNREGTGNPDSGGAEDIRPSVHIVDCDYVPVRPGCHVVTQRPLPLQSHSRSRTLNHGVSPIRPNVLTMATKNSHHTHAHVRGYGHDYSRVSTADYPATDDSAAAQATRYLNAHGASHTRVCYYVHHDHHARYPLARHTLRRSLIVTEALAV